MTKQIAVLNQNNKLCVKPLISRAVGALLIAALTVPEIAQASFTPSAGLAAIVTPIKEAVLAHYATSIFVIGTIGAGLTPGDLRTRAQGFAVGAGLAGAAIIGVKATLGIV